MHVLHNIEALWFTQFCRRKAMSITNCECVFVALVIQHEIRMRRIVICVLPGYSTFIHIVSETAQCSKNGIERINVF